MHCICEPDVFGSSNGNLGSIRFFSRKMLDFDEPSLRIDSTASDQFMRDSTADEIGAELATIPVDIGFFANSNARWKCKQDSHHGTNWT